VTISVAELDAMPEARAAELLASCCGSSTWVTAMLTRRPFGSRDVVLSAADNVWLALDPADWLEAFSQHPRIGERTGAKPQPGSGESWSAGEQARMRDASDAVRADLAEANHRYEERFGYVYIVCATGRTAEEMLEMARARLGNDPGTELAIAAKEQQMIMRIRLEKLLR
jgi:2-oxo-4-hydroxy-4-carboxy-5-ureidoimidazoline decarboxylase